MAAWLTTLLACQGKGESTPSAGGADAGVDASLGGTGGALQGGAGGGGQAAGGGSPGGASGASSGGAAGVGGIPEDPWGMLVPPLWKKATIPGRDMPNCEIFIGDASRVPWPPAAWEPHGAYDVFVVKPPDVDWSYKGNQQAWTMARHQTDGVDELFMPLRHGGVREGAATQFSRMVRVRDLTTVGVLASRFINPDISVCSDGNFREAALDLRYGGLIEPFLAHLNPASGEWAFVPLNDDFPGTHRFDRENPWRMYATSNYVVTRLDHSTGLSEIIRSGQTIRYPASLGDTAVWTEGTSIWALQGDSGPTEIARGAPRTPCNIGITPEWVFGSGEEVGSGFCREYPTNARVWRIKRNADGTFGPLEFGPVLVAQGSVPVARGWGDYIAFAATMNGKIELFIVRLSDWQAWKLHRLGNDGFPSAVWGVDETYLYVGITHSSIDLEELRRYPLSKLDEVAARLDQP